jgi:hypothetical protein
MARRGRIAGWLIAAVVVVIAGFAAAYLSLRPAPPPQTTQPPPDVSAGGPPPSPPPPRPIVIPRERPTPQPGGPVTPPPLTSRFDEVDDALQELIAGNVAFNTPERMQFHESRAIALIASPQLDPTALSQELRRRIGGNDPVAVQEVQIAPLMEAQLVGAPAFEVMALTPTRQPVSRAASTEWRWTVQAMETGKHTLNLTINAVVTVGNENFPRSLNVLNRDIDVYITAPQRVGMFLSGNWQWLLGTIVIPLAVWLWTNQRKQRRRGK